MRKPLDKKNFLPFILTGVILLADQIVKAVVVAKIPLYGVGFTAFNGFFQLIHVRNKGALFSAGANLPDVFRILLLTVGALIFLVLLGFYLVRGKDFTWNQRWFLGGVIGGGLGNIIDRIFRPLGVVDFIDTRWVGSFFSEHLPGLGGISLFRFLYWDRWPTWNIADGCIVVFTCLLVLSIIIEEAKHRKKRIASKS